MHVWLKAIFTCDELPLGDFGFQPKRRFGTWIPWALPKATVKTGLRPKTFQLQFGPFLSQANSNSGQLQFGIEWQVDNRATFVCGAPRRFDHFHTSESFPPGEARFAAALNPADKVAKLLAKSMIEPEVVKAIFVGLLLIVVLPAEVQILHLRIEMRSPVLVNDLRPARLPEF